MIALANGTVILARDATTLQQALVFVPHSFLVNRQRSRQTDRHINRQKNIKQAGGNVHRKAEAQNDRQTDGQTVRHVDGQVDIQTGRQMATCASGWAGIQK